MILTLDVTPAQVHEILVCVRIEVQYNQTYVKDLKEHMDDSLPAAHVLALKIETLKSLEIIENIIYEAYCEACLNNEINNSSKLPTEPKDD